MGSVATRRPNRPLLISLFVAVGIAVAFAVIGLSGRNDEPKTAAWVNGTPIPALHVRDLVEHARAEAKREGNPVPQRGSDDYKALEQSALALLVYDEELEQAGAALGVGVTDAELNRKARTSQESEGGGDPGADLAFRKEGIRGALLYRRIYAHVARGIRVTPREVRAYYDAHASLYRRQGRSFQAARASIAADLRDTRRNAAMARWVAQMKQSFASKVRYGSGFRSQ
jgi:SurA-like protein